jgi:light-regulated signal transduction histidine kinase (bacteriophytochrome)
MLVKDKSVDFATNFQSASKDLRSLFKASEMLVDAFDYLGIYFNPSSAAFGRKRSVDLYKLVDKIRIILMEAEGASLNKKIFITGELRRSVDLYESFKIIPFCLLQNAIKYSFDGEINISFSSTASNVELSVESSGPPISDEEISRVFEKGYRGIWSKGMHHEGLGVGLYIAKIVADAHDLDIKVSSAPRNYSRDGIPVHLNIFSIKFGDGAIVERRKVAR